MDDAAKSIRPAKRDAIAMEDEEKSEESTNEQPAAKSVRREEELVSSPEVIELQQEVRQLEANLEDAFRVARAAELRAETAERRLDSISSQLEDSKRVAERALAVNSELTRKNEELEMQVAAMRNVRVHYRARIDELNRQLVQSEDAMRDLKTRKMLVMAGATSARTRPFISNHPPVVPSLTSTPATINSILAVLSTPPNDVSGRILGSQPQSDVESSKKDGAVETDRLASADPLAGARDVVDGSGVGGDGPSSRLDPPLEAKSTVGVEGVTKNRVGRPAKKTPDVNDHWSAMKKAQESVKVKKYTENPEDWTAFDAFLRRNYQILASSYNEAPSNALALKIKRTVWAELIKGGVPSLWEKDAAKFREEGVKREYWGSETVVEQDDRVVSTERGLRVIPLGGEEIERVSDSEMLEVPRDEQERGYEGGGADIGWIGETVEILENLMQQPCARHLATKDGPNEELAKTCDDLRTLCERVRGREMKTPREVKSAVNSLFISKKLLVNKGSEIYKDLDTLHSQFNLSIRDVIVKFVTSQVQAKPGEESIDRSRRRKQPKHSHQPAHKMRRSAPSVLAAAEVEEDQPSTSSSSRIDDIEDEQTTSTSRRSARRGQGFYRALAGTRTYGKD